MTVNDVLSVLSAYNGAVMAVLGIGLTLAVADAIVEWVRVGWRPE